MLRLPPRSVALAGIGTAFSLFGDQALYVLLPVYFEQLGLVPIQVGILPSANRWIRLYTNHLAHQLLSFLPAPGLLLAAFVLGALTTFSYAFSTSFVLLLMARCLWGLCWSFIRHINVMTVRSASPGEHLAQMMGYYNGIVRLGSIVGIVGGGLLFDSIGFVASMTLFATLSLLAAPLALLGHERPAEGDSTDQQATTTTSGRSPALLICGFCVGSVGPGLVMSTLGFVLAARFGDQLTLPGLTLGVASLTGMLLGVRWALDSIAAPVYGALIDRIGLSRSVPALFAFGAAVLAVVYLHGALAVLIVGIIAFFICGTALFTALSAEASRRGSRTYARFATAGDLGSAVGPLLGWAAIEFITHPEVAFAIGAVLYAGGVMAGRLAFERPDPVRG